jgi:hypothetical protein
MVEGVVDGGMDVEKTLRRSRRFEPLHLALSAHDLMGVFSAIVFSEASFMRAGEAQLPESRAVGAQLVGDQQLRYEALFLEQLAHQPECRLGIAPALNEHVEDLALVVDGAPQVHPLPGDPDDHLVEVPSRSRAWAALPQLSRDQRAEFQPSSPRSARSSSTSR